MFSYETIKVVEELVRRIFRKAGYEIPDTSPCVDCGYDIEAEKNGTKYAIEVKMSRNVLLSRLVVNSIEKLVAVATKEDRTPILVTLNLLSEPLRRHLEEYENLIVVDIRNLLFMVQGDEELRNDLVSILSFSVEQYELIEPKIHVESHSMEKEDSKIDELIEKLNTWKASDESSTEYEKICCQTLKKLFADDLALWNDQKTASAGMFRFDLICKIKDDNGKEFWGIAERYFGSKYIVFEFKNYKDKVTQKEVFTTEKYLYLKALRGIAILVSTNGTDDHANKAIRGILREDGKLIISLSNEDMVEMLQLKKNNEEPADYLSKKLDDLLIDLEK